MCPFFDPALMDEIRDGMKEDDKDGDDLDDNFSSITDTMSSPCKNYPGVAKLCFDHNNSDPTSGSYTSSIEPITKDSVTCELDDNIDRKTPVNFDGNNKETLIH